MWIVVTHESNLFPPTETSRVSEYSSHIKACVQEAPLCIQVTAGDKSADLTMV